MQVRSGSLWYVLDVVTISDDALDMGYRKAPAVVEFLSQVFSMKDLDCLCMYLSHPGIVDPLN